MSEMSARGLKLTRLLHMPSGSWSLEQADLALLWASCRVQEGSELHGRADTKRKLLKILGQALDHATVRDEFQ